jgi:aminoglycoside 6'-N-acetyltransferase
MVVLRPAVVADIELLRSWDQQPHVVAATGDDDNLDWESEITREVDWQWNFIAEVEGRPIGVIMIIDPAQEETHYWGSVESNLRALDIWIGPPEELGRGFGTKMMRLALEFCFANPVITGVLIDPLESNTRARAFYERVGFRFVEYRRFGMDDCAVYRMDRPDA